MDNDIEKMIREKMGVSGNAIAAQARPGGNRSTYYRDLDDWARKVRRDILVIEYHLKKLGVNPADFYQPADPGDPPPPIE